MAIGRADEGSSVHTLAYMGDSQLYVCDYDSGDYTLTKIEEWVKVLSQDNAVDLANVDTVVKRYNGETSTLSSWLRFGATQQGMPELVIGTSANDENLQLTNDTVNFRHGDTVVAYISDDGFVFEKGTVSTSLRVGNYLIRDDGDGGFAIV